MFSHDRLAPCAPTARGLACAGALAGAPAALADGGAGRLFITSAVEHTADHTATFPPAPRHERRAQRLVRRARRLVERRRRPLRRQPVQQAAQRPRHGLPCSGSRSATASSTSRRASTSRRCARSRPGPRASRRRIATPGRRRRARLQPARTSCPTGRSSTPPDRQRRRPGGQDHRPRSRRRHRDVSRDRRLRARRGRCRLRLDGRLRPRGRDARELDLRAGARRGAVRRRRRHGVGARDARRLRQRPDGRPPTPIARG